MAKFEIGVSDEQNSLQVDHGRLCEVIEMILSDANLESAEISVAIIDDPTMHQLNRDHLNHDYPTDVLSFVLERTDSTLDGEVIVSTDTAIARAVEFRLSPADELLLYVIHGTLHLVGYDDKDESKRPAMRQQEVHYLAKFGVRSTDRWASGFSH
ncbi:rRNA maturation RNase YbeY [Planctomycetota bacterium]